MKQLRAVHHSQVRALVLIPTLCLCLASLFVQHLVLSHHTLPPSLLPPPLPPPPTTQYSSSTHLSSSKEMEAILSLRVVSYTSTICGVRKALTSLTSIFSQNLNSPNVNSHLVVGPRYEVFFPFDGWDRAIATMEFHGLVAHWPATLLNHHQLNMCMCVWGKEKTNKIFQLVSRAEEGSGGSWCHPSSLRRAETQSICKPSLIPRPNISHTHILHTLSLKKIGPNYKVYQHVVASIRFLRKFIVYCSGWRKAWDWAGTHFQPKRQRMREWEYMYEIRLHTWKQG